MTQPVPVSARVRAGWEIASLASETVAIEIVPANGADIRDATRRPLGCEVVWKSLWGLRASGISLPASDSAAAWLAAYPGGWQILFPNGGPEASQSRTARNTRTFRPV